jgi:hypothetical protein
MLGVFGIAPAGATPNGGFVCAGTFDNPGFIPPGTFASLTMPPGAWCVVEAGPVTVTHPVTLGQGAGLTTITDLTITGPGVLGDSSSLLYAGGLHIGGQVTVGPNAIFNPYFLPGPWRLTLDRGVTVEDHGGLFIPPESTIKGPVTATNPSAINLVGSKVSGPVSLQGGGSPNGVLTSFFGIPPGAYTWSVLQRNTITGPVTIHGYAGVTVIVEGNQIARGLTVTSNTQLVGNSNPEIASLAPPNTFYVQGNTIGGSANCLNNGTATLLQDWPEGYPGPNAVSGPIDTCE